MSFCLNVLVGSGRNVSCFVLRTLIDLLIVRITFPSCLDICKETQDYNPIMETFNNSLTFYFQLQFRVLSTAHENNKQFNKK